MSSSLPFLGRTPLGLTDADRDVVLASCSVGTPFVCNGCTYKGAISRCVLKHGDVSIGVKWSDFPEYEFRGWASDDMLCPLCTGEDAGCWSHSQLMAKKETALFMEKLQAQRIEMAEMGRRQDAEVASAVQTLFPIDAEVASAVQTLFPIDAELETLDNTGFAALLYSHYQ